METWINTENIHVTASDIHEALGSHTMHELTFAALPTSTRAENIVQSDLEELASNSMPWIGKKAIVRSDGKQIGIVGDGYHLEQPSDVIEHVLGAYIATGEVTIESASYLDDGKKFFYTGFVNGLEADIDGNSVKGRISGGTSFDGSMGATVFQGGFRPVCSNQLALWFSEAKESLLLRARHTKNFEIKVAEAQRHIRQVVDSFHKTTEVYKHLAAKTMSDSATEEYVRTVFDATDKESNSTKLENKIGYVLELRNTQAEKEMVRVDTAFNAYNAVTHYLTHDAGRIEDNRVLSNVVGQGAALNHKALELAVNW